MLGRHSTRTSIQMFQFWRSLTDRMTHQADQTVPGHSLVREPSYLGLNSGNATGSPDMGAQPPQPEAARHRRKKGSPPMALVRSRANPIRTMAALAEALEWPRLRSLSRRPANTSRPATSYRYAWLIRRDLVGRVGEREPEASPGADRPPPAEPRATGCAEKLRSRRCGADDRSC
jgi:hypothetical protein